MQATNDGWIQELLQDDRYQVFADGSIRNTKGLTFGNKSTDGYLQIWYRKKQLAVSRIVCTKFHGFPKPTWQVNHKNGDRKDNRVRNLEWTTASENSKHKYRKLGNPGVKGFAKISEKTAARIRKERKCGAKYKELCSKYGLCKSTISYIVNKKTWK